MFLMIIKFARLLNSNVEYISFIDSNEKFSISRTLNVTQIAVVGGKLESNGIIDDENIDDELKVFYVQSKKVR